MNTGKIGKGRFGRKLVTKDKRIQLQPLLGGIYEVLILQAVDQGLIRFLINRREALAIGKFLLEDLALAPWREEGIAAVRLLGRDFPNPRRSTKR